MVLQQQILISYGSYAELCFSLSQVPDRTARLHQYNQRPHQPLSVQLFLPSLRGLEGGAEPPDPNTGHEG